MIGACIIFIFYFWTLVIYLPSLVKHADLPSDGDKVSQRIEDTQHKKNTTQQRVAFLGFWCESVIDARLLHLISFL